MLQWNRATTTVILTILPIYNSTNDLYYLQETLLKLSSGTSSNAYWYAIFATTTVMKLFNDSRVHSLQERKLKWRTFWKSFWKKWKVFAILFPTFFASTWFGQGALYKLEVQFPGMWKFSNIHEIFGTRTDLGCLHLLQAVANLIKHITIVNYDARVVLTTNLPK